MIEFSTIFLAFVDIFHPKYKYWYDWLRDQEERGTNLGLIISSINNIARVLFAISFLCLRFFYFPYITFTKCLPDFWYNANQTKEVALYVVCVLNLLFAGLQIHWGILIAKQLIKVVTGTAGSDNPKEDMKKKKK